MSNNASEGRACDIAVIGGGAAGIMAAIRAAELGKSVILIERNEALGKKILITGKGRCNLTNIAPVETYIEKFGRQGQFLRSAFSSFFSQDLIEFFHTAGLEVKTERQGRVFPVTDSARSVVETLKNSLGEHGVQMLCNTRLTEISRSSTSFKLVCHGSAGTVTSRRVILATGGSSYKVTGSTGDGLVFSKKLGHTVAELAPGLVPLTTSEAWVKDLQGLGLENIRVTFVSGKKKIVSDIGELMFTHFGVSGPLVLDLSAKVLEALQKSKDDVQLIIDLKPGLTDDQLEKRMIRDFAIDGKAQLKNIFKEYLPQRLIDLFIQLSGISGETRGNQVTQQQRRKLIELFKSLRLSITGSLSQEEAMVTGRGVSTKEIDPRSMESRLVPGLYFAGEIIEGCASSGGYNLQQAFSTGYLAGQSAAASIDRRLAHEG